MDIAAGEYGYDLGYFRRMMAAGAVDVQQIDVTRCGGYTGFVAAAAVAEAHHLDVSGRCGPALHVPVLASVRNARHLEYFHDHVRIERMLFDGGPSLHDGALWPDRDTAGSGLTLKRADAARFAA